MKWMTCWFGVALLLFVLAQSCRQQPEHRTTLARVGKTELTLDDAQERIDTTTRPYDNQLRQYITHWVNEELLYQEARRRGLEHTARFEDQLQETERQLLSQQLLDEEIKSDSSAIDDKALHTYFDKHAAEFVLQENVVELNAIPFATRERASNFAASITRGSSWENALSTIEKDSASQASLALNKSYFTQDALRPSELWKVAESLDTNEVSFPIKTAVGYYVIQLVARYAAGQRATFDAVRDEIRQRLLIERRQHRYEELIGTLRKRYNVEILVPMKQTADTGHAVHE